MKKFVVVSAIFCLGSTVYAQETPPAASADRVPSPLQITLGVVP